MNKTFNKIFDDSNEITLYRVTITSENDQGATIDNVSNREAKEIFNLLRQDTGDGDIEDIQIPESVGGD